MGIYYLKLPKMGESIAEATLTKWLKKVGDKVDIDEPIVEIATDKVDSDVPSEYKGVLIKRNFDIDQIIKVGEVIAEIETNDISDKQIHETAEIFLNYKIPAIIISNTTEDNRDNLINSNKYQKGGLSGKPLEQKSNLLITKFYKILQGNIKIIGVGGVDSGKSVYEKLLCGANFIQLYTGMIYVGPYIVNSIIKELNSILKKEGISNLSSIIGSKS